MNFCCYIHITFTLNDIVKVKTALCLCLAVIAITLSVTEVRGKYFKPNINNCDTPKGAKLGIFVFFKLLQKSAKFKYSKYLLSFNNSFCLSLYILINVQIWYYVKP